MLTNIPKWQGAGAVDDGEYCLLLNLCQLINDVRCDRLDLRELLLVFRCGLRRDDIDDVQVTPQIRQLIEQYHIGSILLVAKNLKCIRHPASAHDRVTDVKQRRPRRRN